MFDRSRSTTFVGLGALVVGFAVSSIAPAESSGEQVEDDPELSGEVVRALVSGAARTGHFSSTSSDCGSETPERPTVHIQSGLSERNGPESELTGRHRIEGCESFVERLDEAGRRSRVGIEPWEISIGAGSIRYDDELVLTVGCVDDLDCSRDSIERHRRLDSLVGPVLSYRTTSSVRVGHGSPSGPEQRTTVDLRTGEPAALTALVEPDSLLTALKDDDWVQGRFDEHPPGDLDSVDELLSTLRETSTSRHFRPTGGYAFYAWDSDREKVAMRIWLNRPVGNRGGSDKYTAIGVWVTPRPKFRDAASAAAVGDGFYLSSEHRPSWWGLGDQIAMALTDREMAEGLETMRFGLARRTYDHDSDRQEFSGWLNISPEFTATRATILPFGRTPSRDLRIDSVEGTTYSDEFRTWRLTFDRESAFEYLDQFDDETREFALVYPPRTPVVLVSADGIEDLPDEIVRSRIMYAVDINTDGYADAVMVRFDCKERTRAPHDYTCTELWTRPGDEWQRRWRRTPL